jgi:hypothetical protein
MTIQERLLKNRQDYAQQVQDIREDWTLSLAAKNAQLNDLYVEAATHERLVGELRQDAQDRYDAGMRKLFSAPTPSIPLRIFIHSATCKLCRPCPETLR